MSAVTVNSRTYSDDSNPVTGLGNGGHRTRLIPLFSDALTEISNQVQTAAQAYRATSTSTVLIGAGSKSFVVAAGKGFFVGDLVVARQATNPSNFMAGAITAFNPTTGALTLSVSPGDFGGSGAISDWVLSGPIGPRGLRGLAGFSYGWDASTVAGDPGAGLMRANNAALASATALYLDALDGLGVDVSGPLTTWGASTSAVKGRLILRSQTDPSQQILYDVTGVTGASGHVVLTVVHRGGAASFAAGVAVDVDFSRTGDKGDVVNPGQQLQFDAGTAAADPGPGKIRFNNAALGGATAAYVDVQDVNGADISAWLATLGAGANAQKGVLRLQSMTSLTKFAEFGVSASTSAAGYFTLTLAYLNPSPAPAFAAGEPLALIWSRAGDKGDAGVAGSITNAGDGSVTAPGFAFAAETGLGIRRKGAGLAAVAAAGADLMELRIASQAEAEAGTNALALMSPQRVKQAIAKNALANSGGQIVTGDLTLAATSGGAISASPAAPGLFVTLPAANALAAPGRGIFSIYNAGSYDYGIRDNAGKRLGWIPPRGSAVIDAVDISTPAGVWNCVGAEKLGVTAEFVNATLSDVMGGGVQVIDMGSGRSLFLFGQSDLYGLVYDGATRAWGPLTLIRATLSSGVFAGVAISGSQALVVSCQSSSNILQAVVLNVSTTSIAVNTAVVATLAGGIFINSLVLPIIAVGSSFVVSYTRSANVTAIRAITVSGTTPTIGSEAVVSSNTQTTICRLYASGSVVRTVCSLGGSTIQAQPYTVSGATLTAGAGASIVSTDSGSTSLRTFVNSNGNIVAVYLNGGPTATVLRLTGTTEAASSVSLGAAGPPPLNDFSDVIDIGGGKTLVVWARDTQRIFANILTDSAGAASAGTALAIFTPNVILAGNILALFANASSARLLVSGVDGEAGQAQITLNVSTASPTLASATQVRGHLAGLANSESTDLYGRRSACLLRASPAAYVIPAQGVGLGSFALLAASANVIAVPRPRTGARKPIAAGVNDFEGWFGASFGGTGSGGLILTRMECAA
ncbi:MAG: hypothetical protein ACOVVK_24215 [Elsteraceae bacterium]